MVTIAGAARFRVRTAWVAAISVTTPTPTMKEPCRLTHAAISTASGMSARRFPSRTAPATSTTSGSSTKPKSWGRSAMKGFITSVTTPAVSAAGQERAPVRRTSK